MVEYCILTRPGSDYILKFGTKEEICDEWAKRRYNLAPDEEYVVKEVTIEIGNDLTKEQIEDVVEKTYEKYGDH